MKSTRRAYLYLLVALSGFVGCQHYSVTIPQERTVIRIAPIINDADIPQVIAPLSRNLREAIAHDPSWMLTASPDDPDIPVLHIRLLQGKTKVISRDPNDTGRPLSVAKSLVAELNWQPMPPPQWSQLESLRITVEGIYYAQPGLIPSSDDFVAELADRLAQEIFNSITQPALSGPEL
jgi:hypothetical protein